MEAEAADDLPLPPGWAYEPKWDGFRVVMWSPPADDRSGARLDSRNAKPLLRYFPELGPALGRLPSGTVADGEVVVIGDGKLDFDALQNRIHPAESRVRRLAQDTPARLALFDLLALRGEDLHHRPFRERRAILEELAETLGVGATSRAAAGVGGPVGEEPDPDLPWLLSPSTTAVEIARRWFHELEPAGFDGIVAKALDHPYVEGGRDMVKIKHRRTVDCVVGGYRLHKDGRRIGSLLLGLYNPDGELHFIGHCSSFSEAEAAALLEALRPLQPGPERPAPAGFGEHARRPGAASRWSADKELDFIPVRPILVLEVSYDQLTGDRFRHATRFERWRPDKDPRDCTLEQLERREGPTLVEALRLAHQAGDRA
jgi:ATP-dependent DNA ligase